MLRLINIEENDILWMRRRAMHTGATYEIKNSQGPRGLLNVHGRGFTHTYLSNKHSLQKRRDVGVKEAEALRRVKL